MVMTSGGNIDLGTLSSSDGSITAKAGGALSAGTVKADTALLLSAGTGLNARTLTSSTSSIGLESLAGSVTVTGATAKTAFSAFSGETLNVRSFTVTAGGAILKSGGETTLSSGKTTGDIDVASAGNASLGNLTTSSGGKISATSTGGGLSFATLRAGTGITLDAATFVSGRDLYVTKGMVDLLARSGDINFSTLSVATPVGVSQLKTLAGSIGVRRITGLAPEQLTADASGGTTSLPRGY